MDVLADRPGEWMETTTLAKAIGKERKTVKGIWTHVGRHIKSQYSDRPWPLDNKWGPEIDADRLP